MTSSAPGRAHFSRSSPDSLTDHRAIVRRQPNVQQTCKSLTPKNAHPPTTMPHADGLFVPKSAQRSGNDGVSHGDRCRAFVATRSTPTAAREDLVVLRAAINHHRQEGHCHAIVQVVLPDKAVGRERWCTRSEIAKLLWRAWRFRETQEGVPTERRSRRHVARFILVAVYTGTRAGAVCAAALEQTEGKGWIDLDRGIFYRRPAGERETKKRKPPVPLPRRLLAHLRRGHEH